MELNCNGGAPGGESCPRLPAARVLGRRQPLRLCERERHLAPMYRVKPISLAESGRGNRSSFVQVALPPVTVSPGTPSQVA